MKKNFIPWIEKYRPNELKTIAFDPINKKIFDNILKTNYFPNLLIYGPPGTGKTTSVINLIKEYQLKNNQTSKELTQHLNASDERGIDKTGYPVSGSFKVMYSDRQLRYYVCQNQTTQFPS